MTSVQQDFSGGINAFRDETKLADNEHIYAQNVRSRTGAMEGIKKPVKYTIDAAHTFPGQLAQVYPGVNFTAYNCYILRIINWKSFIFAVVLFTNKASDQQGNVVIFRLLDVGGMWSVVFDPSQQPINAYPRYTVGMNISGSNQLLSNIINDCYTVELPSSYEFSQRTSMGDNPYSEPVYDAALSTNDRTETGLLVVWNQPIFDAGVTKLYTVAIMLKKAQPDNLFQVNTKQDSWSTSTRQYVPKYGCNGLTYSAVVS